MGPCFVLLKQHIAELLSPLQQANFHVRFGLVAYAAGKHRGNVVYDHTFVGGSGSRLIQELYSSQPNPDNYFSTDPAAVARVLAGLRPQGNEDTLLALDIAADFPFGSAANTRRVIALFSDEKLETGVSENEPISKLPDLVDKLMSRRIQLFVAAPVSSGLEQLAAVDRAEIEPVVGGDGLKSVDFKKLLAQMGKSISVASLQMGAEPAWKKAIYGQDRWSDAKFASAQDKTIIASTGEIAGVMVECSNLGVLLDNSGSMTSYLPALRKQITTNFPKAVHREVDNCMLILGAGTLGDNLAEMSKMLECGCDAIYWFSDFQDPRTGDAVCALHEKLKKHVAKLYIRSVECKPSDLIAIAESTHGGYKNGRPEQVGGVWT